MTDHTQQYADLARLLEAATASVPEGDGWLPVVLERNKARMLLGHWETYLPDMLTALQSIHAENERLRGALKEAAWKLAQIGQMHTIDDERVIAERCMKLGQAGYREAKAALAAWNNRTPSPTDLPRVASEAMVEAALHARVPGGAEVWHWLPQTHDGKPHLTAYNVIRAALDAAISGPAGGDAGEVDDYELEQRAFHAANQAQSVEVYQQLIRDLWRAYCEMEIRACLSSPDRFAEGLEALKLARRYMRAAVTGLAVNPFKGRDDLAIVDAAIRNLNAHSSDDDSGKTQP